MAHDIFQDIPEKEQYQSPKEFLRHFRENVSTLTGQELSPTFGNGQGTIIGNAAAFMETYFEEPDNRIAYNFGFASQNGETSLSLYTYDGVMLTLGSNGYVVFFARHYATLPHLFKNTEDTKMHRLDGKTSPYIEVDPKIPDTQLSITNETKREMHRWLNTHYLKLTQGRK